MAKRDYYDVLNIPRTASQAQIKAAYRKLARTYHPDVNKSPDAGDKFKEATEAYEVLGDPQKRKAYDQFGHAGPARAGGPGPGGRTYTWSSAGGAPFDFGEMFGRRGGSGFMGMSLDDILESLGAAGPGTRRRRPPQRGQDLQSEITLDFLQAVRGANVDIRLARPDSAGGSRTEKITVKIPPGVDEGSKIRIRGKGADSPAGGAGDLYIVTHVMAHPYFSRHGKDIYVTLPISPAEAAVGGGIDVPTIDGMTTVKVPPGSTSGLKLRLRGRGVKALGPAAGDQYVVLKIALPKSVSSEGAKLLKDFDSAEKFDPRRDAPWK